MRRLLMLTAVVLAAACSESTATPPVEDDGAGGQGQVVSSSAASTGGGEGGEGGACGTALGTLAEGLTELAFDDGLPDDHVRAQTWSFNNGEFPLAEVPIHEAVRFELEHPATLHGFKVMWTDLPDGVDARLELEAGLYPDFGYNGFDFWAAEPYWTGSRCAGDVAEGEWVTYAFDEPITIDHPGLVYVAHRSEAPGLGVWPFDTTVDIEDEANPCPTFDACQSAINVPEAQLDLYYNGLSIPFQYRYMVRLLVSYEGDVGPEDTFFQPVEGTPENQHASWGDYDNDGYDDLLVAGPTLWRNDGDGTFTKVNDTAGDLADAWGTGGVWGDYDNDGCLDLFVYAEDLTHPDQLLRNQCDGTFVDVTVAAGLLDAQAYEDCGNAETNTVSPSAAAAWVDIDGDGLLDLYVANFTCWAEETFYADTVFRNNGDGTFADWTAERGFTSQRTPSRTVAPIDHDGDGDIDVLVGNYRLRPNLLFDNDGDGTVTERAKTRGLAGNVVQLYYGHTIGLAWGDIDNDGDFDSVQANLAHPRFFDFSDKTQVLLNDGTGKYSDSWGDIASPFSASGLRYQETHSVPALGDFDNDGNLDLVITCVYDGRPTDFYWGNGDGTFTLDAYHAGITTENGWGIALADVDNDGDVDVYATSLFDNTLSGDDKGSWLQVRAVGDVASNRAAIGATVWVDAGGVTRIRHVQGGTGKGGQDSMYLHFGLADATSVDEIRVRFPGGGEVTYEGPIELDQRVWVYESGAVAPGWAPPSD